jgi:hypothetical protein
MRGLLKRGTATATPDADPRQDASQAARATCGLLTCPGCGLQLESLVLRCPRCRAEIPLGCSGNCRECGKAKG